MSSPAGYISLLNGLGMRELLDGPMCSITCSGVMPGCKVMILALFSRVTSEKSLKPTIVAKHPLKMADAASNPMVVARSRIFVPLPISSGATLNMCPASLFTPGVPDPKKNSVKFSTHSRRLKWNGLDHPN